MIDYTSPENDDLYVYAVGNGSLEYEQKHVYVDSERIEQYTERGSDSWERLLYVHEDVMGNTYYYTKTTGGTFADLEYDAWGMPQSPNKLINNDHGNYVFATFTGHIYDTTLDIYFAEARFYDATNRTWMAMDPIKSGYNWYQYCYSNPTTYWDPLGLIPYAAYFQQYTGSESFAEGVIPYAAALQNPLGYYSATYDIDFFESLKIFAKKSYDGLTSALSDMWNRYNEIQMQNIALQQEIQQIQYESFVNGVSNLWDSYTQMTYDNMVLQNEITRQQYQIVSDFFTRLFDPNEWETEYGDGTAAVSYWDYNNSGNYLLGRWAVSAATGEGEIGVDSFDGHFYEDDAENIPGRKQKDDQLYFGSGVGGGASVATGSANAQFGLEDVFGIAVEGDVSVGNAEAKLGLKMNLDEGTAYFGGEAGANVYEYSGGVGLYIGDLVIIVGGEAYRGGASAEAYLKFENGVLTGKLGGSVGAGAGIYFKIGRVFDDYSDTEEDAS